MPDEHREITDRKITCLLSPDRGTILDPFTVLTFMPIEPHHHVVDIGCGPGYFAIPLAKHLIHGKLYALDTNRQMLDVLRQRVDQTKLGNVEILQHNDKTFPIPTGSIDGAFLSFVLHENQNQRALLTGVQRLLRPKGWCTVLEWYKEPSEIGPPIDMRIGPGELTSLAKACGFGPKSTRNLNNHHYMTVFGNES